MSMQPVDGLNVRGLQERGDRIEGWVLLERGDVYFGFFLFWHQY